MRSLQTHGWVRLFGTVRTSTTRCSEFRTASCAISSWVSVPCPNVKRSTISSVYPLRTAFILGYGLAPRLGDLDCLVPYEIEGDHDRRSVRGTVFFRFAPNFVFEIERFSADARYPAPDRDFFTVEQLPFVRELDRRLNHPVLAVDRRFHHLRKIFRAHHFGPANVGDVVYVPHHVHIGERNVEARDQRVA